MASTKDKDGQEKSMSGPIVIIFVGVQVMINILVAYRFYCQKGYMSELLDKWRSGRTDMAMNTGILARTQDVHIVETAKAIRDLNEKVNSHRNWIDDLKLIQMNIKKMLDKHEDRITKNQVVRKMVDTESRNIEKFRILRGNIEVHDELFELMLNHLELKAVHEPEQIVLVDKVDS